MASQETETLEHALVIKAWKDADFREHLERDAASALRLLNVTVPDSVKVVVRVQRPDTLYYMVPPLAKPGEDTTRPINQTDFWKSDVTGVPERSAVSDPAPDIFDDHYRRLRTDPALRQRLIANPADGLNEHFGAMPGSGKCRIEVISQDPGTIVILLPAPPEPVQAAELDARAEAASSRIYDVLFNSGIGGYFILSTSLTWVLRDFRSKVAGKPLPSSPSTSWSQNLGR